MNAPTTTLSPQVHSARQPSPPGTPLVLELRDVSLQIAKGLDAPLVLSELNLRVPTRGHLMAVLGPSGCGKSTLLKVIAGLREPSMGTIVWEGRDLATEGDLDAHEIGYVPQFSIAHDLLTVRESIFSALQLRVRGLTARQEEARVEEILRGVGMEEIADRRVGILSGGQRRRLALALEMVSSPHLLLCDEVTSGLDPKAEDEIAQLLYKLSRLDDRLVLTVTHSLRHLDICDSVLVLFEGHIAFHGAPGVLCHYFGIDHLDELFPRLAARDVAKWHRSWAKHRPAYYEQGEMEPSDIAAPVRSTAVSKAKKPHRSEHTPPAFRQFRVLVARRWRLFLRDRGQLLLQLALLFGFPCLVVIFALDGLPEMKRLTDAPMGNLLTQVQTEFAQKSDIMRTGSLVSGLVMFQVVLLSLMGANNGAREIAGERLLFEKEKFAGLSPMAYVLSKAVFLGVLVVAQSVWMALFVHWIVQFPGDLGTQTLILVLVNAAMTAVCLGLSSLLRSAEQASLVAIYLVGFQLPLSGAVLALPSGLSALTRPFIAAYWGWSGFIQGLRDTRFYDAVQQVTQTRLAPDSLCAWVLLGHVVLGLYFAYTGCRSARWE